MELGMQFQQFTWVLENFSGSDNKTYDSRNFAVADCNWHLYARPSTNDDKYLSVFLRLLHRTSPPGWRGFVRLSLTLVNKDCPESNKLFESMHLQSFDAKDSIWGFDKVLPLYKLQDRREGFLDENNRLTFVADLHVKPVGPVKITAPPSCKEGNQASNASVLKSQGPSSCQVAQETENVDDDNDDDASEEGTDDDDTSEEGSDDDDDDNDDDASSPVSDDDDDDSSLDKWLRNKFSDLAKKTSCEIDGDASEEGTDDDDTSKEGSDDDDDDASSPVSDDDDDDDSSPVSDYGSLLNHSRNALENSSHTVDLAIRLRNFFSALDKKTSCEIDSAPKEDVDDEASSLVTSVNARNGSSLDQVKSLEDDAYQTVENGDVGFNTVASVSETSNSVLEEMQPVKETMDVNGFEVCSSQVESVRRIFKRHPDIAVEFRAKNQRLRKACMNFLLSLIETLCQSLEELSDEDLVEADIALTYLKDAGFKVDWLEKKLDQLKENKEKERSGLDRLQEIEEELLKLKQKCSDLDALAEKEKSELSATRTALSFDDLV